MTKAKHRTDQYIVFGTWTVAGIAGLFMYSVSSVLLTLIGVVGKYNNMLAILIAGVSVYRTAHNIWERNKI